MDKSWWKGAVIYQIYPRSFKDGNQDGIGDLDGITEELDYIRDLGVDAIWLSPIFRSPMKDFGYDISDYREIDPLFGTMADFDRLLEASHERGIKVILDQVYNHTSDQHPWFKESCSSKDNPKADWYVWVDGEKGTPPNNWLSYFGGEAWEWVETRKQYYLHLFVKEQPDLNWRHHEVRKQVMQSIKFWLDKGVDGFRFDVVNLFYKDDRLRDNPVKYPEEPIAFNRHYHLYTRDRPETEGAVEEIRELMDFYDDRVSIGEVATELGQAQYFAYTRPNRLNLAFNFDFKELRPFAAKTYTEHVKLNESVFRDFAWPSYVLGNHDSKRFLSKLGEGEDALRKAKVLAALLLTLRGTPFIYYGEEIGMREAEIPYEKIVDPQGKNLWPKNVGRDGCRTPMQWNSGLYAGFSRTEPWLPIGGDVQEVNVERQKADPASMLQYYKQLIRIRKASDALRFGRLEFLETKEEALMAFFRIGESERNLVLLNFGDRAICLNLEDFGVKTWRYLGGTTSHPVGFSGLSLSLEPYEAAILETN